VTDFNDLRIDGRVATPSDADWDEVRPGWNLAAELNPSSIAFVESAEDVAETVRFAAANGLRVAGQGTGHGATPLAPLDDTILIRTTGMRGVKVDPDAETARVEAGVLSLELGEAANAQGLCFLPGSSPDVGVIGYTLGGGLSWLGRKHGFACNHVRSIDLVTADGEPRRVDAETEPDLFWAMRGGGGGYAIVTALEVDLVPVAEVYAGVLIFPAEVGADAVRTYRDWAATVSDDVTSVVRFITPPPFPDVPRAFARHAAADDRRRMRRHPEGGGRGIRTPEGDRRDDHGHVRVDARRRVEPHPHGPRESGAGSRRRGVARRAVRRGDRRLGRHGRSGLELAPAA
jgi:FAD/FMN-containing dehydrogenase